MRQHDDAGLSEVDYENLPEALRRKYFSSLERLRLAHDGTCSNLPRPPSSRKASLSHNRNSFHRSQSISSFQDPHRPFRSHPSVRRRLQKTRSQSQANRPPTSASEFASLPPAIQRKQFSREEQVLLSSRVQQEVILDAADEAVYRKHRYQSISDNTASSYAESISSDLYGDSEIELHDSGRKMDPADLQTFRWLDEDEELDLTLDDYHAVIAANAAKHSSPKRKRRGSFRRGLSMSNVSFHRRSSSSTSLHSPLPGFAPMHQFSTLPPPGPILRHQSKASISSLDPSATHYQDPTARMKLRVYLASPQKFDEAIEFGFPSLQDQAAQSARPRTSPAQPDPSRGTFFNDDTPSLSADDETEDKEEPRCQDSPRTPETWVFPPHRPSHQSISDRSFLRPQIMRGHTESAIQPSARDREMTLHMTLTRPDLRSPEENYHVRTSNVNETPLEQAPLTVPNHVQSIWDELPEEPSRVKRFLKKMKIRA